MDSLAASALAIGLFAAPALAADIAPAPTYSWDGVYIGVVGFVVWLRDARTVTDTSTVDETEAIPA